MHPPPPRTAADTSDAAGDRFSAYPEGSGSEKLTVSELGFICVGDERVDVRGLHDVVNERQLTALGFLLRHLMTYNADRRVDLAQRVDELYREIEENGLDTVYSSHFTTCGRFLDLPRKAELLALAARLRLVRFAGRAVKPKTPEAAAASGVSHGCSDVQKQRRPFQKKGVFFTQFSFGPDVRTRSAFTVCCKGR